MPLYSYTQYDAEKSEFVPNGRTVTRFFSMKEDHPQTISVDGELYKRDVLADHGKVAHKPGNWPLMSDAAGVVPEQIGEAMSEARKAGIPTDFTPDGKAVFRSPGHRRQYLKHIGLQDLAAYN